MERQKEQTVYQVIASTESYLERRKKKIKLQTEIQNKGKIIYIKKSREKGASLSVLHLF
jgi:hypothetical protein